MPVTISVCMIVKNEEAVLERCLQGVRLFADELIMVDTGSTDRTKQIAAQYTERVYDFSWTDDFSAARNYAFSLASCDYRMWVDADDVIDSENARLIRQLKQTVQEDAVAMFYERAEYGLTLYYLRMVRNSPQIRWKGTIHEYLAGWQTVLETDILIQHRKEKPLDFRCNRRIMEKLTQAELNGNFALCANCYLDCVLDDAPEAARYLSLAGDCGPLSQPDRVDTWALIGMVLAARQKHTAVLQWAELMLRQGIQPETVDWAAGERAAAFCLQAVKSAVCLQSSRHAWLCNELALRFDASCAPALRNREKIKAKMQRH